jgi:hypothetical protein
MSRKVENLLRQYSKSGDTVKITLKNSDNRIGYLRAKTINELINQVVRCFVDQERTILNGEQSTGLIASIPSSNALDRILRSQ